MSAVEILRQVIQENTPRSIWTDAPLESFRRVENTNRGEIGELTKKADDLDDVVRLPGWIRATLDTPPAARA